MNPTERVLAAAVLLVAFPVVLVAFLGGAERLIRRLGAVRVQARTRPVVWLLPGAALMGTVLVYPLGETVRLSFMDPDGQHYVGWENYEWVLTSGDVRSVLVNTGVWVVVMPVGTLLLGLAVSVLLDRVRYERVARSILIMPTAISFVAAAVVWTLMFAYQPPGSPQTGTLNALWVLTGAAPVTWVVDPTTANAALIFIVVWIYLGFATIVLSAGLKAIPTELLDAVRVDGASEWQAFWWVTLRLLRPTILVVLTTLVVWALRVFDIVFVFTQGRYGTDVIGQRVYQELFAALEYGRGSALAVVLFLAVLPFMVVNVVRVTKDSAAPR